LISIRSLLEDPNENSPANVEAAQLFRTNPQAYYSKVKECVEFSIKEEGGD
jgi:ubiquitin-protein ligase